jgi:Pyruvate/2-oxoacid:ferredoxin oxidoreductase delta subunit
MRRKIIKIDKEKCNGCGLYILGCKENAIQIVDGKAILVSEIFCDGLGACLGHCPEGAINLEENDAEPYSERMVIETILSNIPSFPGGQLEHLLEHNEKELYNDAINILNEYKVQIPINQIPVFKADKSSGCPGSKTIDSRKNSQKIEHVSDKSKSKSELRQWPLQLHLVSPKASYFVESELVIMSTCGPIASAEIHRKYLKNRAVVIACPKLDNTEPYTEKLSQIYSKSMTPRVIVVIMEVPCCKGLSQIAVLAATLSNREDIIVEEHTLSLDGTLMNIEIIYHN